MYDFAYHRAASVEDAVVRHAASADGRYLAGGQTLIPTLKMRLAAPSDVVDIGRLRGLDSIAIAGDTVSIGALARHADVAADAALKARIPALAGLAGQIGDAQVRNLGTLGGSLAHNDPAADYPAAALALGATIRTDRRAIAARDFFHGMFETALEPGELITGADFPVPLAAGWAKFRNPASRYAIVGVFVVRTATGVRVAVTGAAPCVFRAESFERALEKDFSKAALDGLSWSAEGLNEDLFADAPYRAHLIGVMTGRAVEAA